MTAPHCHLSRTLSQAVLAALVLLGCALGGCFNPDFDQVRREHAETFPAELAARSAEAMQAVGCPLDLEACIAIALANNLELQVERINRRLATLDRRIAFARFLPQVDAELTWRSSDVQQKIGSHGVFNAMGDRSVAEAVLSAQQSILDPAAWFIYQARRRGEDVRALVQRRTAEQIALQVTTLYYACLSLDRRQAALEAASRQALALQGELEALDGQEMALDADMQRAAALVLARRLDADGNARQNQRTRAALLEAMGLSPTAELVLAGDEPLDAEAMAPRELADDVLEALLNRSEMAVADRNIEIRADEMRVAIAEFLPRLAGFGGFTNSGDSFLKYENVWSYGLSATMSVFDGFASVHDYKAARARRGQAMIQREQQCMQIMLEVIEARTQYDQAVDGVAVAEQARRAAQAALDAIEARWREGLVLGSDKLDVVATVAAAEADLDTAAFQLRVAAATYADVLGRGPLNDDRSPDAEASPDDETPADVPGPVALGSQPAGK